MKAGLFFQSRSIFKTKTFRQTQDNFSKVGLIFEGRTYTQNKILAITSIQSPPEFQNSMAPILGAPHQRIIFNFIPDWTRLRFPGRSMTILQSIQNQSRINRISPESIQNKQNYKKSHIFLKFPSTKKKQI